MEDIEKKAELTSSENVEVTQEIKKEAEAQPKIKEVEELANFLNDPQQKKNALLLAEQIQALVGKKWFSLDTLSKKTQRSESVNSLYKKIQILELFKLSVNRPSIALDGRENLHQLLYKIVISKEDKIQLVDDMIKYHETAVADLKLKRLSLQA